MTQPSVPTSSQSVVSLQGCSYNSSQAASEKKQPATSIPRTKPNFCKNQELDKLSTSELQRVVLMEQFKTAKIQQEYYNFKLKILKDRKDEDLLLEFNEAIQDL